MLTLPTLWTLVLLSLEATTSTALSIDLRAVAPGSAGPVAPYSDNYTELASGVRIYGTPSRVPVSLVTADVEKAKRGPNPLADGSISSPRAAAGWCSASTIYNDGSENSPLISDCQVIASQVYELAGSNNAYFGRSECNPDSSGQFTCYFPVVSYQTCMFGVSTITAGLGVSVRVGWQDVGDLITDSISQCGSNPASGKVGTSGEMSCPEEISAILTFLTGWGLYHS